MNWKVLTDESQLNEIDQKSLDPSVKGVLIFKHSTRCGTSSLALDRLERNWDIPPELLPIYFLDLIKNRSLSGKIAEKYAVEHKSPQILVIKNEKCIYSESHFNIRISDLHDLI